jgi:hypothetical protein
MLAMCCILAIPAAANMIYSIDLDNSTSLLDGSSFTAGTIYYTAFQLTGGDASNSSAFLSGFALGGGSAVAPSPADPVAGTYAVVPDPADPAGIFQTNGALTLAIAPGNSYSLYTQQFTSGTQLSFAVSLDGVFLGGTPDAFSFQLYDSGLDTLLYEQDFAILDSGSPASVPEPGSAGLMLAGLALVMCFCRRRTAMPARS